MKNLQRFCAAAVLSLTLGLSAFAGDISCPGVVDPPPEQHQVATTGDISCPGITATGDMSTPVIAAVDPVTEAALGLLQSVLSIF